MKKVIGIIGSEGHGRATLLKAIEIRRKHIVGETPDVVLGMGSDGVIVVVSAIDGPMAHTREAILMARQFGIESIVVFISHCDLVEDTGLIDLEETEMRELLSKHHLDGVNATIIRGSSKAVIEAEKDAEKPIDELIEAIKKIKARPSDPNGKPSMRFNADIKMLLPEDGGASRAILNREKVIIVSRDACFEGEIELPPDRRPALPGDGMKIAFIADQPSTTFRGMGFVMSIPALDKIVAAGRVTEIF